MKKARIKTLSSTLIHGRGLPDEKARIKMLSSALIHCRGLPDEKSND